MYLSINCFYFSSCCIFLFIVLFFIFVRLFAFYFFSSFLSNIFLLSIYHSVAFYFIISLFIIHLAFYPIFNIAGFYFSFCCFFFNFYFVAFYHISISSFIGLIFSSILILFLEFLKLFSSFSFFSSCFNPVTFHNPFEYFFKFSSYQFKCLPLNLDAFNFNFLSLTFFIFHLVSFYLSPSYRYLCFIFHSLFFKYFIFNLIAFLNFELAILILIFFILRRFNFYLFIFHLVSFTVYLLLISFNFSDYFDLFTCLYAPSIFSLFLLHIIRFVLMSFFHLLPFYPFIFSCLLSFFTGYLHNIFYLSLILFLPFYILFSFIFHLFIFMHYSVTFNI